MNDGLILRSAIDLMSSETAIRWSNKNMLPPGYAWNEEGYVITDVPYPFLRSCVGLRFGFLIGKLGVKEYLKQNLIVLRLLNDRVHKAIVSAALYAAFARAGMNVKKDVYNEVVNEVYLMTTAPALDNNFVTWRRTWFSEKCEYKRVSQVVRAENNNKIDADRELMNIDEKYITSAVAEFTGFSRHRIDNYWSEKRWDKKLRTIYTLEEGFAELSKQGIDDPSRAQLAEITGLSLRTLSALVKDLQKMVNESSQAKSLSENTMNNER
jgi:hypothetical protein